MRTLPSQLSLLARIGLCLALAGASLGAQQPAPASAPAVALVVDRNDDAVVLACGAAANDCTLRGAIQKANTNGVADVITFSESMTITLGSPLDLTAAGTSILATDTQRVEIDADGIAGNVFHIQANDNSLAGLRLYGSGTDYAVVWISNAAQRVRIAFNVIGDDDAGFAGSCGNSPDSHSGIYISSSAVPAGADALAWIYGNHIKCIRGDPGHGIMSASADEIVIGADSAGNAGLAQLNFIAGNSGSGVYFQTNANDNTVRNSALAFNVGSGIVIDNSDDNRVYGNQVVDNYEAGIVVTATAKLNAIGCPEGTLDNSDQTLVNHIVRNRADGITIHGTGTISNTVLCNWIGLDSLNSIDTGNHRNGLRVANGAQFNVIGMDAGTRNFISNNFDFGIELTGAGTTSNTLRGNYIGTTLTGTAALPNLAGGLNIADGAMFNLVGGPIGIHRNLIAGNNNLGLQIEGSTTATNTVINNAIGVNVSAGNLPVPNAGPGILLDNETHGNVIGTVSHGNQVGFNAADGLLVTDGAFFNRLVGNVVYSNTGSGIRLDGAGTAFNVITQTVLAHNGLDGLAEGPDATLNVWSRLSTYANGGLGIDKNTFSDDSNVPDLPFPVITEVHAAAGVITGTATANSLVEVYRVYPNWSGMGEGEAFLGSTVSDGSGNWSLGVEPGSACYTAFQTVGFIIEASSEFGPNTCRVFAPVILR